MKYFSLSVITLLVLLSGCKESSSSTTTKVKNIESAEKNIQLLSSINAINYSTISTVEADTSLKKVQKISLSGLRDNNCKISGKRSYQLSYISEMLTINYNQCKNDSSYDDGIIAIQKGESQNYNVDIKNFTHQDSDGEEFINAIVNIQDESNSKHKDLIINGIYKEKEVSALNYTTLNLQDMHVIKDESTASKSWTTLNGFVDLNSSCLVGQFQVKTVEKLINLDRKEGTVDSGILEVNGVTYTFEKPYVTIKLNDEETTLLQTEVLNSTKSCSNQ